MKKRYWIFTALAVSGLSMALAKNPAVDSKSNEPSSSATFIAPQDLSDEEGAAQLSALIHKIRQDRLSGKSGIRSLTVEIEIPSLVQNADWGSSYRNAYPNGDMYFLIGDLDNSWTEKEFTRYYTIAKWLTKFGFRPIINPVAFESDVREAVQSPTTSGIIWSSHADKNGRVYDSSQRALPQDVFSTDSGKRLGHFVFSNCFGEQTNQYYRFAPKMARHYWDGTTTSDDLFNYLISDDWNRALEKDLKIQLFKKPSA